MQGIKNIIFDLGGVIIPLDQAKTLEAFNRLSYMPFDDLYNSDSPNELFNKLDKGEISNEHFFEELRRALRYEGPDENLMNAWNAMLLDVPEERLDVLVEMKQNYQTFLLSNTCEPHIAAFEHDLYIRHGVRNFNDYFDKVYYSCRIGMRKPDPGIFEFVLTENNLKPEETVFIDDSVQHVKAAGTVGINSYLLPPNTEIGDFLTELGLR
jgi:glucose-1-phosphatase